MKFKANIYIRLKPGHSDPEGATAVKSLRDLRYDVNDVRVAKVYEVVFLADSLHQARKTVDEMCKRLLANPVKDDYEYDVVEMK